MSFSQLDLSGKLHHGKKIIDFPFFFLFAEFSEIANWLCNDLIYRKARVHCSLAILKNQLYFRSQYLLLLAPAEGNVFFFKQYLSRRWNQKTAHELSQSAFTRSAFSYQSAK